MSRLNRFKKRTKKISKVVTKKSPNAEVEAFRASADYTAYRPVNEEAKKCCVTGITSEKEPIIYSKTPYVTGWVALSVAVRLALGGTPKDIKTSIRRAPRVIKRIGKKRSERVNAGEAEGRTGKRKLRRPGKRQKR